MIGAETGIYSPRFVAQNAPPISAQYVVWFEPAAEKFRAAASSLLGNYAERRENAVYFRRVLPIKNWSTADAAFRPSEMAQTTRDWPRRMSPAEKMPGTEVM